MFRNCSTWNTAQAPTKFSPTIFKLGYYIFFFLLITSEFTYKVAILKGIFLYKDYYEVNDALVAFTC